MKAVRHLHNYAGSSADTHVFSAALDRLLVII
jgi:hypothetical protein